MNPIEEKARSQIMAIEQVHDIRFQNREEIARLIARSSSNESQVLLVCSAINFWVAENAIRGQARIPEDLVLDMVKIKRQRSPVQPERDGKKGMPKGEKD